ncbi:MAG: TRAP transporter large permease subunit, partial [Anaerolineales bacterium]
PVLQGADFSAHLGEGGPILFMTWFIVMLSVNLQTSFLTPPFGFTLFYMKGTVPSSVTMAHIYRGIMPFVILLEERKRTNHIHNELYSLIEELESKFKLLLPPGESQP